VLTRIELPQAVAVIVFVYGGFLASARCGCACDENIFWNRARW